MPETFEITVIYKNKERKFEAALTTFGYSYKIEVITDGVPVIFEPDEEKNYRAYLPTTPHTQPLPDPLLLQAIAEALEKAFK